MSSTGSGQKSSNQIPDVTCQAGAGAISFLKSDERKKEERKKGKEGRKKEKKRKGP